VGKLPERWPCKCGAEMALRRGRPYRCDACGAGVSSSAVRGRRGLVAAKSKPGRAVKLLLPMLTDWR
jgi:hypothetical protein